MPPAEIDGRSGDNSIVPRRGEGAVPVDRRRPRPWAPLASASPFGGDTSLALSRDEVLNRPRPSSPRVGERELPMNGRSSFLPQLRLPDEEEAPGVPAVEPESLEEILQMVLVSMSSLCVRLPSREDLSASSVAVSVTVGGSSTTALSVVGVGGRRGSGRGAKRILRLVVAELGLVPGPSRSVDTSDEDPEAMGDGGDCGAR